MKLKSTPRSTATSRRVPRTTRSGASRMGARPKGRQARKPGTSLRQRLSGRMPSIRRAIAALAAAAAVAGLVMLLNGPWLRVSDVTWAGARYTSDESLAEALEPQRGRSILAVDTRAVRERLERMPAVATARVVADLTGRVEATLEERTAAFVWQTSRARFLTAADGTVFAALSVDDPLPQDLASVPRIVDERFAARLVGVGDRIPAELLEPTAEILSVDPVALGSTTSAVSVRLDDEFGFRLVSADPAWEVALGVYGTNPRETAAEASARLERQVTAVRTLFASHPESGIGWVDVRNPGKVYFRAGG